MKLKLIVFTLFHLVTTIKCLDSATPSEMMYLYSAYKIDWKKEDPYNPSIAKDCKPYVKTQDLELKQSLWRETEKAGLVGICSFGDFAHRIIHSSTVKYSIKQSPKLFTLEPDLADVAKELGLHGIKTTDVSGTKRNKHVRYQPDLVCSKIPKVDNIKLHPFATLLQVVENTVKDARIKAKGLDIPLLNIKLARSNKYLSLTKFHRVSD